MVIAPKVLQTASLYYGKKKIQAPTPIFLEYLAFITLMSLWMPYSSNLALLPTSWKCRVCNTKVQCIFSTSFNAWSSKLGPYLTYSLVHEMIYLLLELKNNKLATNTLLAESKDGS